MANGSGTSATVNPGQQTVVPVQFGAAGFCMLPGRILFDSATSWVADVPDHRAILSAAMDRMARSATARLLVVGHTDDVGSPAGNDPLSERRARAVLAVLARDVAEWEATYRTERVDGDTTPWGRTTFVSMLSATGTAPTQQAINEHRDLGPAGQARRATLFAAYFRVLLPDPAPPPPGSPPAPPRTVRSTSPPTLGCGENHVLGTGDHAPSRRVEMVFFSGTGTPTIDCPSYPGWSNACAPIPLPPDPLPVPPATATFHVFVGGSDTSGDGSLARPWRTFRHAFEQIAILRQANQLVTLNVLGGAYTERVVIPSGTTVLGLGDPKPTLQGIAGEPVVLMAGGRDKHLRNLRVSGGERSGVRIENARDVSVRACVIAENRAPRGGGVSIVESTGVVVADCVIEDNRAGDLAQAIPHVVLELLPDLVDDCGDWKIVQIQQLEFTAGHSHGGGVYVENSGNVAIRDNCIRRNQAILFGGGVAVDNRADFTGAVTIERNEIICNQVSHGDVAALGAGGGCEGPDMGDPVRDRMMDEIPSTGWIPIPGIPFLLEPRRRQAAEVAVSLLHGAGRESGMGGAIALRHVSPLTRIARNQVGVDRLGGAAPNRARRGGGISLYTGAYPELADNRIAFNLSSDDGGGICIDQFDPFLPVGQPTFLGFSRGTLVPRQVIPMSGNFVHDNRCTEDGGGMYATGGVRLEITGDTVFRGNRAGQNGGGIRISYAVRLTATEATFSGNHCQTGGTGSNGGGGLAARNAEFHLTRCTFTDNVSNGFAGGGVYCITTFEGGFNERGFIKNRRAQFDALMEQEHGFTVRRYRLTDCAGSGNRATGASGAGGFAYALRDPTVECGSPRGGDQPLHVRLDGAATAIGVNTSEFERMGDPTRLRRKRANVTIELSGQNDAAGRPQDRVRIEGLGPVPGSVALSTPTPDEKAIAVLHDRTQARPDEAPTTFPYQNVDPFVRDLQPRFGPEAGGTAVSITGDAFLAGVVVTFDGEPATIDSVTPTEIRVTTPPLRLGRVPGGVEVVVTNPDTREERLPGGFEYTRLSLASIVPGVGAADRTTDATVTGTGFTAGTQVFAGSEPCAVLSRTGHRELRVTVPASPTGGAATADVNVVNPGEPPQRIADGWEWRLRPLISDVHPRGVPPAGGTVRITGARFTTGTQVAFGGQPGVVLNSTSTTLDVAVPGQGPLTPNTVDVEVSDGGLTDIVAGGLTYADPPVITPPLDPASGPSTSSSTTRIHGSGFAAPLTVKFGTVPATTVISVRPTEIEVSVPPPVTAGTTVDVTVENPDGQTAVAAGAFTYL